MPGYGGGRVGGVVFCRRRPASAACENTRSVMRSSAHLRSTQRTCARCIGLPCFCNDAAFAPCTHGGGVQFVEQDVLLLTFFLSFFLRLLWSMEKDAEALDFVGAL